MKTDDLIGLLAQDAATAPTTLRAALPRLLPPALLAALAGVVLVLGLRTSLGETAILQATAMKWCLGFVAAAVGGFAASRLARPVADARAPLIALAAIPAVAGLLVAAGGGSGDPAAALKCLTAVPLTAALPLAALLLALRDGAVTRPALAGAFAGLAAAGLAILAYALHCTEDAPRFVGTWYVAAAALTAGAGALLGPRVLRW